MAARTRTALAIAFWVGPLRDGEEGGWGVAGGRPVGDAPEAGTELVNAGRPAGGVPGQRTHGPANHRVRPMTSWRQPLDVECVLSSGDPDRSGHHRSAAR